ncbi:MAG: tRNA (guanosine(46)-N7)-methyltransferase TrmB [Candidatus Gracilibacteria bacterium]
MTRKKLKRFAEIKKFKNVFQKKGKYFKNKNPVVLELGCGAGHYTLALAEKFPKKNFIGVDRKGDRIWQAARKALAEKRKNTAFINGYIERLGEYFKKDEVSEIWITFPDPYPKPSRAGHRLTAPKFLEIYKKLFGEKGGTIHLKTDALKLFEYSLEMLKKNGFKVVEEIRDLHSKKKIGELLKIRTLYEEKFIKEGRKIYYLRAQFKTQSK